MSSRSVRRRKHKQIRRLGTLSDSQRPAVANQFLHHWQAEARHRAKWLGALPVWRLATDPHMQDMIRTLDPTGELLTNLRRVSAEAIAEVIDRRMVPLCRPPIARAMFRKR